jgi:hypothetical protein
VGGREEDGELNEIPKSLQSCEFANASQNRAGKQEFQGLLKSGANHLKSQKSGGWEELMFESPSVQKFPT